MLAQQASLDNLSRATGNLVTGGKPCNTNDCVVRIVPANFPTITKQYGNFRITLHKSYIALLDEVLAEFAAAQPALFAVMGTQGGYGCRLTKAATCGPNLSIHSYGMAADLTFNGFTDAQSTTYR